MAKRIIVTVLLVLFVFGTVWAQNANQHIAQGREHMTAGNYAAAVASFDAAAKLGNRNAQTLLREAQIKRMEEAFNLGQGLFREGKFEEAITKYGSAIQYAPPGHNTRNIQAARNDAQRAMQEHEEQVQQTQIRERTEQSVLAFRTANENFIAGKYAEAVASYENAISIGGLSPSDAAEAQRLLAEAKDVQAKMVSLNRALRDEDFDVVQNQTGVTIRRYLGTENRTINIGGTNHVINLGILNVAIPPRIYGAIVTNIGNNAFRNTGITNVVIPNSVTEIGIGAFAENKLERVTLGTGIRIIRGSVIEGRAEAADMGAFEGNPALTNVVIPDTVTEIGPRAFRDCGLTSVTLGRAVAIIGESAFRNNNLTVVTLPVSVRRIHRFAFHGNQIQSLTIPNGVEAIWDDAFTNNPMTSVVIPPSLAQTIILNGQTVPRIGGDHVLFSAVIPSFPDTLNRVTLPLNVNERNMAGFDESLRNFYINQRMAAGTYFKNGPIWQRQ
jgi:tetratricopeptide (TPR) repeat protein